MLDTVPLSNASLMYQVITSQVLFSLINININESKINLDLSNTVAHYMYKNLT